jgi:Protein of unknown function (DUF1360)
MQPIPLAAAVLAVWRVTHSLVEEDGPWDVLRRTRSLAERARLGRLVNCFLCCSVWVAIPFAWLVAPMWRDLAIAIPALSGGAILLERATAHRSDAAAAWIETTKEVDDELLRE